jgi:hypothetical protein
LRLSCFRSHHQHLQQLLASIENAL